MSDHFSPIATDYAAYRPRYPSALFDWLASLPARRELAWEAGCGSGQATAGLAARFGRVVACDASAAQVAAATAPPNSELVVADAGSSGLASGSVDLAAAAQALHWFDRTAFFAEARRVLAPGGVIAVWCYGTARFDEPALAGIFTRFYSETVGPWWPAERVIVEDGYRSLDFPFAELDVPAFEMTADPTLDELMGYIGTWSAVVRYRQDTGTDPLPALRELLLSAWGAPEARRRVEWPLSVRAGR